MITSRWADSCDDANPISEQEGAPVHCTTEACSLLQRPRRGIVRAIDVRRRLENLRTEASVNTSGRGSDPPRSHRGKTVSKLFALEPLGLALSEKQIPQIVETIRSVEN